ncbi:uncharacterized amino acid permease YfnA [Arthrobacter sp. Hiyo4]|nr:uncharacterized amino acid permease YfnA [Arthrobacter sp. Hiyo4]
MLAGSATVFFAVFGYDAMSTAAEEATDGKKHMPKAIVLSLIVAMLLYVAATLVLTGMQNYQDIDPKAGFASAFTSVGLPVIATIISVFAVLSILTVMLTFLLGVTRVWFSMSRDGLLPGWFAKTDRHGTPQRVTWIAGITSAFLAGVFPIKEVADLTNIGILAAFVVVCLAVIVFRYKKPDAPRSFRLPLMPLVPAFGILSSGFLMTQLPLATWGRFGVWLVVGLAIYFFYGRKHSLMNPNSPRHEEAVEMHRPSPDPGRSLTFCTFLLDALSLLGRERRTLSHILWGRVRPFVVVFQGLREGYPKMGRK